MTIEVTILISVISVAFAIFFGLSNYKRGNVKDLTEKVKDDTRFEMKLDEIGRNVSDIKYDISATKKEVQELSNKLIAVEASTKSAHRRLDMFEQKKHEDE